MILRRASLLLLVALLAAAVGIATRDLRQSRVEVPSEQAGEDAAMQGASAPSPTAVPKWSTRGVDIPSDVATWSIRISPDGTSLAALSPNVGMSYVCTSDKVSGAPVCPTPVPQRVVRYALSDPPGAITATLKKVADAPQNGGSSWIADGGLLVAELDLPIPGAKLGPKTVTLSVVEPDGRVTRLGNIEGASAPRAMLSPDGRWLAFAGLSAQVTFVERHGAAIKTVPLDGIGIAAPPAWTADGRLLVGKGASALLVSPTGAVERVAGPTAADLLGVASASPDRAAFVFGALRSHNETYALFADGRWVDVPATLAQPATWVTAHELLLRERDGSLRALDALTGRIRDLGFTIRASDPRILAHSAPYLMWRDGDAGRIHLLDTRSAYDAVVGVTDVLGVQTYAGGGFLILHSNGGELLTGGDWFARLPPTAAPFVSAAPPKPGAKDPFADVKALPRIDQMTTGGALTVESRNGSTKRVKSEDGGWSLEVPTDWRADVGRLRGAELYSFDPTGRDYSGNAPGPAEVRISLTLWPDFEQRGPAWFAESQSGPGRVISREVTNVVLAGAPAYRVVTTEQQPGPSFFPTRARWYLRHPWFADRVIEVILYGADASTLATAERALSSLRLFEPVSGPREPLLTRREAMQSVLPPNAKPTPSPATAERVEAKLVRLKELELTQASGGSYSLDADTPLWVVVRFGDLPPNPRSMRGPGPFPNWTWQFTVIDARTGQGFSGGGGAGGSEPSWWPSLRDRSQ